MAKKTNKHEDLGELLAAELQAQEAEVKKMSRDELIEWCRENLDIAKSVGASGSNYEQVFFRNILDLDQFEAIVSLTNQDHSLYKSFRMALKKHCEGGSDIPTFIMRHFLEIELGIKQRPKKKVGRKPTNIFLRA